MVSGVSVVVPTYQRADGLPAVVAPLLADPALRELIVVVDGSQDASMAVLARLAEQDPRLRPIWQPNSGAGAARQRGVEEATGDVVLLLDDDVVAEPGLVTGHAQEHARHPGRVVLGRMPTVVPPRRRPDDATTALYDKRYEHACQEFLDHPEQILHGFWSGNVSLPRDVAVRVGLGDPALADLYPSEDRELGLRLRAAGIEAVFRPELVARHLHRRSLPRFVTDCRGQGRAQQVLHQRYPDVVPAPTARWLAGRLPLPARWLVQLARRSPRAGRAAQSLVLHLVHGLGVLRLWAAQDVGLVLLQRIAQAAGAREWDEGGACTSSR